jgi:hypothetical protein
MPGHPAKRASRLLVMREAGKEVLLPLLAYFENGDLGNKKD